MTGGDALAGLAPYLPLLARMALVAMFVIVVALVAERLGPFLGGMVASLPLYTGPVYLMLALERSPEYMVSASVGSLAICGAIPIFVLVYAMLAATQGAFVSALGALMAWSGVAALVRLHEWSIVEALLFVAPIFAVAVPLGQSFTRGVALKVAKRRWTDLALRAVLVGLFTGGVIAASRHLPPQVTGILSVLPILLTSLTLVMHPRVGGPATAALLAHTLAGLIGMVVAFAWVHNTIAWIGIWPSLGCGLAITVGWNVMLIGLKRASAGRASGHARARSPSSAR